MSVIRLFFIKKLLRRIKSRTDYNNIEFARRGFEKVAGRFNTQLKGFGYKEEIIEGIKSEWVIPNGADESKVLLYFHGGGYATGSINTHRALVSKIAEYSGITALSINYRLAPEFKYPAPVEDATAVYLWLLQKGFLNTNICFGGDSAGGGLTICTLTYLRDKGILLPKCAIALSPWLDLSMSGDSYHTKHDEDPMLVAEGFPIWSKNYLGDADTKVAYASPIFHDLSKLPPIYIQVGEEEMLLDDSTRFAVKAKEQGVDVKLEIFSKKFHVFNAFWRVLPKAREANKKLGLFLQEELNS
ncbi:MAG: alpha/beta hydrolase [Bacteroidota bacterium]